MGKKEKNPTTGRLSARSKIWLILFLLAAVGTAVFSIVQYVRYGVAVYVVLLILSLLMIAAMVLLTVRFRPILQKWPLICLLGILIVSGSLIATIALPWPFLSKDPDLYEKQMNYLSDKRLIPHFFPKHLSDETHGYEIRFMPDQFSSDGYIYVSFHCPSYSLAEFRKTARKESIVSPMRLSEAKAAELDAVYKGELAEFFGVEVTELEMYSLQIAFPKDIDEHPDTRVYVLSCSLDPDHPNTEVILVDMHKNWVCFSRMI
ncbi:MAG: hypothetical protein J5379_11170 [Clostridiales bacterium]|nr:hypothetical protein [Clostridiales bacterium]